MKRVALLGATGSIGLQAREVIGAHPELELVAAASGSRDVSGLAPPDPGRRRPDRAAGPCRARCRAERGARVRRAPRDALGARARRRPRAREQGEPRRGRRALHGALAPRGGAPASRRQRALGGFPVPRGPRSGARSIRSCSPRRAARFAAARATSSSASRSRRRSHTRRGRWGGRSRRLGDAREQGPGAARGARPVRAHLRADRGRRAPELHRPRARPLPRRRSARAPRLPGHARPDLVRAHVSGAGGHAGPAARARRADARVPRARSGDVPAARARPATPGSAEGPTRARTTPRTRSPSPRSWRAGFRSSLSPASWSRSRSVDGEPAAISTSCVEADAEARRRGENRRWRSWREHHGRDPRARAADPRARGRPLLRVARGRDAPAEVLHRLPARHS